MYLLYIGPKRANPPKMKNSIELNVLENFRKKIWRMLLENTAAHPNFSVWEDSTMVWATLIC